MDPRDFDPETPVLIAGPTASGKSALALRIATARGAAVVNADALQVYSTWRILTARPTDAELKQAPHRLYGHVGRDETYSVGHWLRDVTPLLTERPAPVIVGGTGLYFMALTEGLAEIPETPPEIRAEGERLDHQARLNALDAETAARIDCANPARVARAWEVLRTTGRGLAEWQAATPAPILPLAHVHALLLDASKDWLTPRIAHRFDAMIAAGALEEAADNLPGWDPCRPSSKAIGAPELIAHLRGQMTLSDARDAAIIATRQYAKRQRTWFRARASGWTKVPCAHMADIEPLKD